MAKLVLGALRLNAEKTICRHCEKVHKQQILATSTPSRQFSSGDQKPETDSVHLKQYPYFYRVLESLPGNRSLAFAYGSGVFKQAGAVWKRNSMSDFIIATDDPVAWHKENLARNGSHYPALLRSLGPEFLAWIQTGSGAKIYFNTLIPFEDGLIKYGVISTKDLTTDLLDWDTLYTAGRLHKPVNILEESKVNPELTAGLTANLDYALHTALLDLPSRCSEKDLFLSIAGISYTGDLRMIVGEDKNKVSNIVEAQLDLFRNLYSKRLKTLSDYVMIENGVLTHDASESGRYYHLTLLPSTLQQTLVHQWNQDGRERDVEEVLYSAAKDPYLSSLALRKGITSIVKRSSTPQAIKGVVTAGPYKAVQYSLAKLKKMMKSLQNAK